MPRCISPLTLRQKGIRNIVPCGRCLNCLETKRDQWSFRIRQELRLAISAKFLTLTYTDSDVPISENGEMQLDKSHMQLFMKKLRKIDAKNHRQSRRLLHPVPPTLRYYTVGEYGTETDRPHYHSIMFNLHNATLGKITEIWGKGNVKIGTVTPASIHYVTKYVINRVGDYTDKQKPFANISQGLGQNYLHNGDYHTHAGLRTYVVQDERKLSMPRYYKEKLFTVSELRYLSTLAKIKSHEQQAEEIQEISKLHQNPLAYLNERQRANYELKEKRVNSKNTF